MFGDTVNKASKMESSGRRDKIQVSEETAEILKASGLKNWLVPREDTVSIMGKGEMKTYWLEENCLIETTAPPRSAWTNANTDKMLAEASTTPREIGLVASRQSVAESETEIQETTRVASGVLDERSARRADWVAEVLIRLLKRVIAKRGDQSVVRIGRSQNKSVDESIFFERDTTVLEEVQEHIALPRYDPTCKRELDAESIQLDAVVEDQVHTFVCAVASMYRNNSFHNFEHASHVTMSVSKLLSRIVAPSDMDFQDNVAKKEVLHDHTYGIVSRIIELITKNVAFAKRLTFLSLFPRLRIL